jgi:hypothetical protein
VFSGGVVGDQGILERKKRKKSAENAKKETFWR